MMRKPGYPAIGQIILPDAARMFLISKKSLSGGEDD
jgi:hypothetical protein